jgi:hypothetical protein
MGYLKHASRFFRDSDDRRRRYIETEFRNMAIWSGPGDPDSWRNSNHLDWINNLIFKPTAEWKEKVKEIITALKAINAYQCRLLWIKMLKSVDPSYFEFSVEHGFITKQELLQICW